MRAFQEGRGLLGSGVCDLATWTVLLESGWRLGARHLYLRSPHLRGDDVADLQVVLGSLGFDAGRVDGIFGPDTVRALAEFQRNVGVPPSGVFGHETCTAVLRLGHRAPSTTVAAVREAETGSSILGQGLNRRVLVAVFPELGALGRDLRDHLEHVGYHVTMSEEGDESAHVRRANDLGAGVVVGLAAGGRNSVCYYSTPGFESVAGRALGALLSARLDPLELKGMRLALLRETRMPTVLLTFGALYPQLFPHLAASIAETIDAWNTNR